ncbi:hypothetical protein SA3R_21540, partial [Pantoea dispersa]
TKVSRNLIHMFKPHASLYYQIKIIFILSVILKKTGPYIDEKCTSKIIEVGADVLEKLVTL